MKGLGRGDSCLNDASLDKRPLDVVRRSPLHFGTKLKRENEAFAIFEMLRKQFFEGFRIEVCRDRIEARIGCTHPELDIDTIIKAFVALKFLQRTFVLHSIRENKAFNASAANKRIKNRRSSLRLSARRLCHFNRLNCDRLVDFFLACFNCSRIQFPVSRIAIKQSREAYAGLLIIHMLPLGLPYAMLLSARSIVQHDSQFGNRPS